MANKLKPVAANPQWPSCRPARRSTKVELPLLRGWWAHAAGAYRRIKVIKVTVGEHGWKMRKLGRGLRLFIQEPRR
jgi:hypothetical protein